MKAVTYVDDGTWHDGNPMVLGPMTQATWLGSLIFDGARAFEGVIPDIDLHCARACESARKMMLEPKIRPEAMVEIVKDAVSRFDGSPRSTSSRCSGPTAAGSIRIRTPRGSC